MKQRLYKNLLDFSQPQLSRSDLSSDVRGHVIFLLDWKWSFQSHRLVYICGKQQANSPLDDQFYLKLTGKGVRVDFWQALWMAGDAVH